MYDDDGFSNRSVLGFDVLRMEFGLEWSPPHEESIDSIRVSAKEGERWSPLLIFKRVQSRGSSSNSSIRQLSSEGSGLNILLG